MTTQATAPSITTSIEVNVPVEEAFKVFTEDMGSWWNPDHHIIDAPLERMVFEPRLGGHIYDVGTDGSECRWARVLVYEPPSRLVFSWDISLEWKRESDPNRTSEVSVMFQPVDADTTLVTLEHLGIERHGEGWEKMHAAVGSAGGWPGGLERFAVRANG
jgi:uncharacterized protein YndB with AHSA1/START domain